MLIFPHRSLSLIKRTYVFSSYFPQCLLKWVLLSVYKQNPSLSTGCIHLIFHFFFPCAFYNCWHGFSSPVNNEGWISQWVILSIRSCMSKVTRWLKCQQLHRVLPAFHVPVVVTSSTESVLGVLHNQGGKKPLWSFHDIQQEWSGCNQPSWGFNWFSEKLIIYFSKMWWLLKIFTLIDRYTKWPQILFSFERGSRIYAFYV